MNLVEDFLKTDVILESENDVFIDASVLGKEDLDEWLEEFLYPMIGEHESTWLKAQEFETYEDVYKLLRQDDNWLAVTLMRSALRYARKLPDEKTYYVNDSAGLHMDIPKSMLL